MRLEDLKLGEKRLMIFEFGVGVAVVKGWVVLSRPAVVALAVGDERVFLRRFHHVRRVVVGVPAQMLGEVFDIVREVRFRVMVLRVELRRIHPGEDRCARWSTCRRGRVVAGEEHSFVRHPVAVRGVDAFCASEAQR